jgi:hypothetical protein
MNGFFMWHYEQLGVIILSRTKNKLIKIKFFIQVYRRLSVLFAV